MSECGPGACDTASALAVLTFPRAWGALTGAERAAILQGLEAVCRNAAAWIAPESKAVELHPPAAPR